jgi:hypothetical protein
MEKLIESRFSLKECTSPNGEVSLSIQQLMEEFAEIEYQYFLEKNEKNNAAPNQSNLEIGNNTNKETAA